MILLLLHVHLHAIPSVYSVLHTAIDTHQVDMFLNTKAHPQS